MIEVDFSCVDEKAILVLILAQRRKMVPCKPLGAGAAPAVAAFTTDLVRTSDAYRGWRDSPFVHPFLNDSRAPRNTQVFSPSHEAWRKHPMLQVSYRSMCAPPDVLDPAVAI